MKDKVAEANSKKYLKAPSIEEISAFIDELGVTDLQFERFYEIPYRTMGKVRNGQVNFPTRYWHFVYEKVIPTYGLSVQGNVQNSPITKSNGKRKPITKSYTETATSNERLGGLITKINDKDDSL